MRVATLSVGICQYRHDYIADGDNLRFAADAATSMHRYFASSWSIRQEDRISHHILIDQEANRKAIEESISQIAEKGPWDIVLLYFSGHGKQSNCGQGSFLDYDSNNDQPGISGNEFSDLLDKVDSKYCLLILDCCYAAGILEGCSFFSRLPESVRARLWLCSSNKWEPSWEESELKLPVFTFCLLSALQSRHPDAKQPDHLDLESELFPKLRDRVSSDVAQFKQGASQTPLRGGISNGPLNLPLRGTGIFGDITHSEIVRRALWRFGKIALWLVIGFLICVQLLFYTITTTPDGRLAVSRGITQTQFLRPAGTQRTETSFLAYDLLSSASDSVKLQFRNNEIDGVWLQNDAQGRRKWLSDLLGRLENNSTTYRLNARIGNSVEDKDLLANAWERGYEWVIEGASEAALLQSDLSNDYFDSLFLPDDIPCSGDSSYDFDFELIKPSTSDIESRLESATKLLGTSVIDPYKNTALIQTAIAYRVASNRNHIDCAREIRAYARCARALAHGRRLRGVPETELDPDLFGFTDPECRDWYYLTFCAQGHPLPPGPLKHYLKLVSQADPEFSPSVQLAFYILVESARQGNISATDYREIYSSLSDAGSVSTAEFNRYRWLRSTWTFIPQGTDLRIQSKNKSNSIDLVLPHALLASRSPNDLTQIDRRSWEEIASSLSSDFNGSIDLSAHAARLGLIEASDLDGRWPESPQITLKFLHERDQESGGYNLDEYSDTYQWGFIVGLALANTNRVLPENKTLLLAKLAERAAFVQLEMDSIYNTLAFQWYRPFGGPDFNLAQKIHQRLGNCYRSARKFVTEQGAASAALHRTPISERYEVLQKLTRLWEECSEPELKIGLGTVIISGYQLEPDFASISMLEYRLVPAFTQ